MKKKRNNYTAEEKVSILKRHLVDKVPVSDLCDKYNLSPTVFTVGKNSSLKMVLQPLKLCARPKKLIRNDE